MLSLEQVRLLETKVAQTVEYIKRLSGENASLRKKLDTNQKRIDELEVLVSRFKEEQGRIEDGILSALDRLSQFENAMEKSLASRNKEARPAAREKPVKTHESAAQAAVPGTKDEASVSEKAAAAEERVDSVIPDIQDPLEFDRDAEEQPDGGSPGENSELDIF